MKVLLRVLSVLCLLGAAFMTAVIITAVGSGDELKVGPFIAYCIGTIVLFALVVVLWRRSNEQPAAPAGT